MRIIALEEHFVPADLFAAWAMLPERERDISYGQSAAGGLRQLLEDTAGVRLREMDRAGIDKQVLSLTTAGVQALQDAVPMSRRMNDMAARMVGGRPDRFEAFATLPLGTPEAAATELRRAVCELGLSGAMIYGRVGDVNLDDPRFQPVWAEAERLRAPVYVHPQAPTPAVRQAYYTGLGEALDSVLASGGIGWHYETGIQVLRLMLAGTFERFPDLQLILGHWGELVMFYLERIDTHLAEAAGLKRSVSEIWRSNVYVTPSGIFSARYLAWAMDVIGPDRLMFATDYPYERAGDGEARRFVEQADLDPGDREKFASANWERLTAGIRRSG